MMVGRTVNRWWLRSLSQQKPEEPVDREQTTRLAEPPLSSPPEQRGSLEGTLASSEPPQKPTPSTVVAVLVFAVTAIFSFSLSSRSTTVFAVTPIALPPSVHLPGRRVRSRWLLQTRLEKNAESKDQPC
ncbi:hypothetical protein PIB30_039191 [Stylosanthes scabra]|uniref:Uncharacterized protein n=1 Tax=Stylosanthes scabra TaxID=79078 RepID=A0ABU6YEM2_9FABA|nr:hypothetical protein [Stylosanthes scabra]